MRETRRLEITQKGFQMGRAQSNCVRVIVKSGSWGIPWSDFKVAIEYTGALFLSMLTPLYNNLYNIFIHCSPVCTDVGCDFPGTAMADPTSVNVQPLPGSRCTCKRLAALCISLISAM